MLWETVKQIKTSFICLILKTEKEKKQQITSIYCKSFLVHSTQTKSYFKTVLEINRGLWHSHMI